LSTPTIQETNVLLTKAQYIVQLLIELRVVLVELCETIVDGGFVEVIVGIVTLFFPGCLKLFDGRECTP
jgi:hypothetical protein